MSTRTVLIAAMVMGQMIGGPMLPSTYGGYRAPALRDPEKDAANPKAAEDKRARRAAKRMSKAG